jgi:hypothetical protein
MREELENAIKTIRGGQLNEGLVKLDALISLNQDPEALGHRAWLLRSMNRYQDAVSDYQAITRMNPDEMDLCALMSDPAADRSKRRGCKGRPGDLGEGSGKQTCTLQVLSLVQLASTTPQKSNQEVNGANPPGRSGRFSKMIDLLENDRGHFSASIHPDVARTHANEAGLSEYVTYYKGESAKTIASTFDPEQVRFDFAFIDADHTIDGC